MKVLDASFEVVPLARAVLWSELAKRCSSIDSVGEADKKLYDTIKSLCSARSDVKRLRTVCELNKGRMSRVLRACCQLERADVREYTRLFAKFRKCRPHATIVEIPTDHVEIERRLESAGRSTEFATKLMRALASVKMGTPDSLRMLQEEEQAVRSVHPSADVSHLRSLFQSDVAAAKSVSGRRIPLASRSCDTYDKLAQFFLSHAGSKVFLDSVARDWKRCCVLVQKLKVRNVRLRVSCTEPEAVRELHAQRGHAGRAIRTLLAPRRLGRVLDVSGEVVHTFRPSSIDRDALERRFEERGRRLARLLVNYLAMAGVRTERPLGFGGFGSWPFARSKPDQEELATMETEVRNLKKQLATFQQEKRNLEFSLAELSQEIKSNEAQKKRLQNEESELHQSLIDIAQKIDKKEEKVLELEENLQRISHLIEEKEKTKKDSDIRAADLEDAIKRVGDRIIDLDAEQEAKVATLHSTRNTNQQIIIATRLEIDNLQTKKAMLNEHYRQLNADITALTEAIQPLTEARNDLENSTNALTLEVTSLTENVMQLNKAKNQLDEENRRLTQKLQELDDQHRSLSQQITTTDQQIARLNEQRAAKAEENANLSATRKDLEDENAKTKLEIEALRQALESHIEEKAEVDARVDEEVEKMEPDVKLRTQKEEPYTLDLHRLRSEMSFKDVPALFRPPKCELMRDGKSVSLSQFTKMAQALSRIKEFEPLLKKDHEAFGNVNVIAMPTTYPLFSRWNTSQLIVGEKGKLHSPVIEGAIDVEWLNAVPPKSMLLHKKSVTPEYVTMIADGKKYTFRNKWPRFKQDEGVYCVHALPVLKKMWRESGNTVRPEDEEDANRQGMFDNPSAEIRNLQFRVDQLTQKKKEASAHKQKEIDSDIQNLNKKIEALKEKEASKETEPVFVETDDVHHDFQKRKRGLKKPSKKKNQKNSVSVAIVDFSDDELVPFKKVLKTIDVLPVDVALQEIQIGGDIAKVPSDMDKALKMMRLAERVAKVYEEAKEVLQGVNVELDFPDIEETEEKTVDVEKVYEVIDETLTNANKNLADTVDILITNAEENFKRIHVECEKIYGSYAPSENPIKALHDVETKIVEYYNAECAVIQIHTFEMIKRQFKTIGLPDNILAYMEATFSPVLHFYYAMSLAETIVEHAFAAMLPRQLVSSVVETPEKTMKETATEYVESNGEKLQDFSKNGVKFLADSMKDGAKYLGTKAIDRIANVYPYTANSKKAYAMTAATGMLGTLAYWSGALSLAGQFGGALWSLATPYVIPGALFAGGILALDQANQSFGETHELQRKTHELQRMIKLAHGASHTFKQKFSNFPTIKPFLVPFEDIRAYLKDKDKYEATSKFERKLQSMLERPTGMDERAKLDDLQNKLQVRSKEYGDEIAQLTTQETEKQAEHSQAVEEHDGMADTEEKREKQAQISEIQEELNKLETRRKEIEIKKHRDDNLVARINNVPADEIQQLLETIKRALWKETTLIEKYQEKYQDFIDRLKEKKHELCFGAYSIQLAHHTCGKIPSKLKWEEDAPKKLSYDRTSHYEKKINEIIGSQEEIDPSNKTYFESMTNDELSRYAAKTNQNLEKLKQGLDRVAQRLYIKDKPDDVVEPYAVMSEKDYNRLAMWVSAEEQKFYRVYGGYVFYEPYTVAVSEAREEVKEMRKYITGLSDSMHSKSSSEQKLLVAKEITKLHITIQAKNALINESKLLVKREVESDATWRYMAYWTDSEKIYDLFVTCPDDPVLQHILNKDRLVARYVRSCHILGKKQLKQLLKKDSKFDPLPCKVDGDFPQIRKVAKIIRELRSHDVEKMDETTIKLKEVLDLAPKLYALVKRGKDSRYRLARWSYHHSDQFSKIRDKLQEVFNSEEVKPHMDEHEEKEDTREARLVARFISEQCYTYLDEHCEPSVGEAWLGNVGYQGNDCELLVEKVKGKLRAVHVLSFMDYKQGQIRYVRGSECRLTNQDALAHLIEQIPAEIYPMMYVPRERSIAMFSTSAAAPSSQPMSSLRRHLAASSRQGAKYVHESLQSGVVHCTLCNHKGRFSRWRDHELHDLEELYGPETAKILIAGLQSRATLFV